MKFMGLLPAEYSSGAQRRQGAITEAGNPQARRVLVEGAWASRYPAQVRRHLQLRLEKQSTVLQAIRWQAQGRLCQRYRRRVARGQHATVVTGAMARELLGCMWASAQEGPGVAEDHAGSCWYVSQRPVQLGKAPRCMGRDAAPVRGNPRQREEAGTGHTRRDRGRHPTDTRKVVPNPRLFAGSTVAYCWLRRFRCTEVKKHDEDLKNRLAPLDIGSHINAALQAPPIAEA